MPFTPVLYTLEGSSRRELVRGVSNTLDWQVEVGSAAPDGGLANPSFQLMRGTQTLYSGTPTISGGAMTITLASDLLDGINISEELMEAWVVDVTHGGETQRERRRSVVVVTDIRMRPSVPWSRILAKHPDLSGNYPKSQTSWDVQRRRGFVKMKNWILKQGRLRNPNFIVDQESLTELELAFIMVEISTVMASAHRMGGSTWVAFQEDYIKELAAAKGEARAETRAEDRSTVFPNQPSEVDDSTYEQPGFFSRREDGRL